MNEDFGGLITNLTNVPVRRKKNKIKENSGGTLIQPSVTFPRPKIKIPFANKSSFQKIKENKFENLPVSQPKLPETTKPIFDRTKGILKNNQTVSSHSIWKKFKKFNKSDNSSNLNSSKPEINSFSSKKTEAEKSSHFNSKLKKVSFNENYIEKNLSDSSVVLQSSDLSSNIIEKNLKNTPKTFTNNNNYLKSQSPSSHEELFNKRKKIKQLKINENVNNFNSNYSQNNGKKINKMTSLFRNNPEIPEIAHRFVRPIKEDVFSKVCFSSLNIHPYMVKYLKESMNLTTATTIQAKSIPVLLENKDALIRSQTGSGKTLAFALPILHKLQELRPKINRKDGVLTLIIIPTRELVLQTYEIFIKLARSYTWIVPGYLVGGEKRKSEKARLRKGITILIGTPGRLIDHVQHTKALKLDKVKCLVIDEADRLLDMGYEKDVAVLLDTLNSNESNIMGEEKSSDDKPERRQTILLSATLTPKVQKLAGLSLREPVFVDACEKNSNSTSHVPIDTGDVETETETMVLPYNLSQKYVVIPPKLKLVSLASFILTIFRSNDKVGLSKKVLIFMGTQDMVDYYAELLSAIFGSSEEENHLSFSLPGAELFKLHGNMKQAERTEVFKIFRKSSLGVLLCTDVAARGLDLPEVDWVIQFTGPISVSDYVHRVGRTARGGQSGSSIIFLTPNEVGFIGKLENCQIRVEEEKMETCLDYLAEGSEARRRPGKTNEEASRLQMKFEKFVVDDGKLYDLACKAYASWSRFYASYPKNLRDVFSVKDVHQGHYAKSFALKDAPSVVINYAKMNNLNEKRFPRKRLQEKTDLEGKSDRFRGKRQKMTKISEYDSGLEPLPKKKR